MSHRKTKPEIGLFYTKSADIAGAAEAVSTGLSSAMNQLSGFASLFPEKEDPMMEKLERQLQAQKVSNTMAGEEKKEERCIGDDNPLMSDGRPLPQRFDARVPSENSPEHASAFKIHKPTPLQASKSSATAGSSPNRSRAKSASSKSEGSRAITTTAPIARAPMARMRNSYDQLSSSLDADVRSSAHKRPKTQEEIRTAKQRKWKKQMQLAKKRRQQERKELEEDDDPDHGSNGPGFIDAMLEKFLPEPHKLLQLVQAKCGNIEDVSESDYSNFSGSSEDASYSSSVQEESRATDASSPARSSKSARRGRSRRARPARSSPDSKGESLARSKSRTSVARSNSRPSGVRSNSRTSGATSKSRPSGARSKSRTSGARSTSRSRHSSSSGQSASRVSTSPTSEPDPPLKESRQSMRGAFPVEPERPSLCPTELQRPQSSHDIALESLGRSTEWLPPPAGTDYPMDSLTKKALELNIFPDSFVGPGSETIKQVSSPASYKHHAAASPSAMNADPNDKSFVKAFIQDVTTHGCSLHWHSEPMSMAPHFVRMHLKLGHCAPSGSQCGPRLVWVDIKTPDNTFGIDLFDIRSLDKAGAMHLKDYPFAIPGRSIFLKLTRGRDFVFEASTEVQARRFIHGMRWVVARLAFNLVIGNLDVSCELLDVGLTDGKKARPDTALEESRLTKAMDDVTNQLVDKSVFHL